MSCTPNTIPLRGAGMVGPRPDNPWNKAEGMEEFLTHQGNSSFKELMSEDLAKDLQQREEQILLDSSTSSEMNLNSPLLDLGTSVDTSNDLFLALLLQHEFNKEHDSQIRREEKHYNKNSKLSVSLSKYKVCAESYESEEEDCNLDDENRVLDSFEERRRSDPVIPACGYTRHNNRMVTKHDKNISGRRNAERVMNFPPGINTGDGGGFDMQISNNVYNKLARSAMSELKRKQRVHDKVDKATAEKALDPKTRLIMYKMVNNSVLECVNGIVSTGKESVVFHAIGGVYEDEKLPSECAVKVFKTTLTDFKTRERYIRDDYRFRDRMSKNNNKMMIQMWAEKEFHNLRRLQKANIASPKPVLIKKHVLIMSFIGYKQSAASKLKHMRLSYDQWCSAYEQVVDIMTTMFRGCKLVHGDMSEYNILWFEEKCWVIDLGQAVEPVHPNALRFLHRDCSNIIGFFKSKGLINLQSPLQLFEKITGINLPGQEEEAERLIEEYEVNQELWRDGGRGPDDQFEVLWNEIKKEESKTLQEDLEELEEELDDLQLTQDFSERTSETPKTKQKKKKKKKKAPKVLVSDEGPAVETTSDFVYLLSEGVELEAQKSSDDICEEEGIELAENKTKSDDK